MVRFDGRDPGFRPYRSARHAQIEENGRRVEHEGRRSANETESVVPIVDEPLELVSAEAAVRTVPRVIGASDRQMKLEASCRRDRTPLVEKRELAASESFFSPTTRLGAVFVRGVPLPPRMRDPTSSFTRLRRQHRIRCTRTALPATLAGPKEHFDVETV
jgi:hypothetical protein